MIDLSIVYPLSEYPAGDKILYEILGDTVSVSSGAGFGERDIQFEVESVERAEELKQKILARQPAWDVAINELDEDFDDSI